MKAWKKIFGTAALAALLCIAVGCGPTEEAGQGSAKPIDGTPILFDETTDYYNIAPSVVEEGNVRYIFYAVNATAGQTDTAIAVRRAEKSGDNWSYGDKKVIVQTSESGWDSAHIANPDVIKGTFGYNGETYSWLMAYQGNGTDAENNYSIGLAAAKDPLGEWVKIGNDAVIKYDSAGYGTAFGIGEPSLVSYDKAGKVYLFHTMGDMYTTGVYVAELDCTDLGAIKGASVSNAVTNFGLTDPGAAVPTFSDTNFKLDETSGTLYCVRNYSTAAMAPVLPTAVQVIKMPMADLYAVNAEWEEVETQINDLDLSTDTLDGWERVYSACIVGDGYGRVDGAEALELALTVTSFDRKTYEYRFYQAITGYTVELDG